MITVSLVTAQAVIVTRTVTSLNHAAFIAARLRRGPFGKPATALHIRHSCGSIIEAWGKRSGRWVRIPF